MGTLSKRPLRDFGLDLKDRIEDFRTSVGGKLDHMQDTPVTTKKHTMPAAARWVLFAGVFLLLGIYVEKSVAALRAR